MVALFGLSACTAGASATTTTTVTSASPSARPSASPTPAAPPTLNLTPASGASTVSPIAPITASVVNGTLTHALLTSSTGRKIAGTMSADKHSWKPGIDLGYGNRYVLTADARGADGQTVHRTTTFSTVTPPTMTMPYIDTTGGASISRGGTYGVGMVVAVHFDEAISNRRLAMSMLHVSTSTHVTGAWYWLDDQNVHWRPKSYYPSGTTVTVTATVFGKQVSPGLYGQSDVSTWFTIGAKHVSIADDTTHQVRVYFNDKFQRSMPTSMGRGGYVTGDHGQQISLYTPSGTYTVIGHDNPELMDSSSFGLPTDSPLGYKEYIYWATRISTDGIFLHQLDTTVWAQGNTDTSHGCLNLNQTNAQWFYQHAQVGDVVKVEHTGGVPLQIWQNGDWTIPWSTWAKHGDLG